MNRNRCIALALCCLLLLALFGCAPSGTEQSPSGQPQSDAAGTQSPDGQAGEESPDAGEAGAYETPVTISTNITDADKMGNDALYDYICEKFNMQWNFIPMQFGERHDKARLWVASGDVPDLLWMDLNENLYTEWLQWVKDGTFKAYPDDLSPWPNLKAAFDMMIGDDLMRVDGKLYATVAKQDLTEYGYGVPMMFVYRADWAEALGLRAEDDVYTWDEFWDMVEACIQQDPGGNGAGKTYGAVAPQWYFPDCFGIWQTQDKVYGTEETSFAAIDGEYVWVPATDNYLTGLKEATELYQRGIIWPDLVLDTNSSLYADLFTSGQCVAINENMGISRIKDYRDKLLEAFPDLDREKCVQIAKISSPVDDSDYWQKESPCYWSGHSMAAGVSDEQMTRYLDFCDYLCSEEGTLFRKYGFEGTDYTLNEDGSVNLLWPKNELGNYTDPYPTGCRGFMGRILLDGGYSDLNNPKYLQEDIDEYAWSQDWDNEHATRRHLDYNLFYTSTPNKDKYGLFTEELKAKAIEVVSTCTVDQVDAVWEAWIQEMLPKVQPVLDDLNNPEYMPYISGSYEEMLEYVSNK